MLWLNFIYGVQTQKTKFETDSRSVQLVKKVFEMVNDNANVYES